MTKSRKTFSVYPRHRSDSLLALLLACLFAGCGLIATQKQEIKDTAAITAIEHGCALRQQSAAQAGASTLAAVNADCEKQLDTLDDAGAP